MSCKLHLQDIIANNLLSRASDFSFSTAAHLPERILPNAVQNTQSVKLEKPNDLTGIVE